MMFHMKKTISFQTSIDNMFLAEKFIDSLTTEYGISEDLYGNILMATTEAVVNAIKHGNKLDSSKFVFVDAEVQDNMLSISVKDEGLGFDFTVLPDPTLTENILKFSGRGIYLIKSLSDQVEFLEGGSLIKISFKL